MYIISRGDWGARHDDGFTNAPIPADEVWAHHSVTLMPDLEWIDVDGDGVDDDEEQAMRNLESIGEDRFGGGISYTWPIMPSGRVYTGHSPWRQGAHTGGRNDRARAICFVGNYEKHRPTRAQIVSAARLLQHAKAEGWIKYARINGGHRDLKATSCPGRYVYEAIAEINRLAAGGPIGGGAAPGQEDDMSSEQYEWLKRVVEENQRRINALPDEIWRRTTVYRDGERIPALQELADAKTQAIANGAENAALRRLVAEKQGVTEERIAEIFRDTVKQHIAITGTVNIGPATEGQEA